ncbi:hypothetical protein [Gemmatimonas aurantiaca]|uniref:hypothetical protein n=1 Tax=Gemmatimonas aurantiaca TaxID=173480 RepID=UPI00301D975B
MKKLLVFIGSTVFSYGGWWLGSTVGIMTSFILSMLGLGVGMWLGARIAGYFDM